MDTPAASLLETALRNMQPGGKTSGIPRIEVHVDQGQDSENACQYRAMACFILQGSKRVSFGDKVLRYEAGHYLVSALDLPLMGQVYSDARQRPYVALTLVLDPALLNELILAMPVAQDDEGSEPGLSTAPMTREIEDVLARALRLMDRPQDISILAPLVERELLYRLLSGQHGKLLRQIASAKGPLPKVRKAIGWIGQNFDRTFKVDDVGAACGMSRATLNRSFREITGLSPLQYQKQLRLLEARRLLISGDYNVSGAAFAVGYESSSQFSRDYLRQFEASPSQDLRRSGTLLPSRRAA
ncbi:AraC family transcriptional regulator [Acidovorax sp. SUPP950]|uniref:AraC family transcriptional regulator n=1 Tax=Acidovorax sp. SUPP950 TaxID=511901 RepID=UPI0023BEF2A4|nr:AraC family transcriptional regulator [Acidovorax sp. SUPP950]GKS75527.1 AraC family transcriptional regulator [Acidovorax sp. SUPP950]